MSPMNNRMMRPRASGGFTPKSISNLAAWYDISSTTDTSKVTTVSGAISALIDLSGNGKNAIQNTANNRPSAVTAAYNGKDVGRFTTSPASVLTALNLTFSTTGFTFFSAIAPTSTNSFQCYWAEGVVGTGIGFAGIGLQSTNHVIFETGTGVSAGVARTLNAMQIVAATGAGVVGGTYAATTFRRNKGTSGTTGTLLTVRTDPDRLYVGAASAGNSDPFGGDIGEILLYSRELATFEIESVERYLAAKWGVTLT